MVMFLGIINSSGIFAGSVSSSEIYRNLHRAHGKRFPGFGQSRKLIGCTSPEGVIDMIAAALERMSH